MGFSVGFCGWKWNAWKNKELKRWFKTNLWPKQSATLLIWGSALAQLLTSHYLICGCVNTVHNNYVYIFAQVALSTFFPLLTQDGHLKLIMARKKIRCLFVKTFKLAAFQHYTACVFICYSTCFIVLFCQSLAPEQLVGSRDWEVCTYDSLNSWWLPNV